MFADNLLKWTREHNLLTFVMNFLVPQQNSMGRMFPRYDLRNPVHFFERLNQALHEAVSRVPQAYLLDADQISATFGRRSVQDDGIDNFTHGGLLSDYGFADDQNRLHPVPSASQLYGARTEEFIAAVWEEALSLFRTARQFDAVKLVVVDLDDTLWRGVLADRNGVATTAIEGWPLGLVEALLCLKRRGILLAILSKNDEAKVVSIFKEVYGGYMSLDDFAAIKINWRPKSENMGELLREVNLLPHSVVFIDDNPVERAAMQASYPELRVLGANQYLLRRILLWAPETQVARVSAESGRRTEMVQAQIRREGDRARLSRSDFLASLAMKMSLETVCSSDDPGFARSLELINKTNQFNTTGRRWTRAEAATFFRGGGLLHTFTVTDQFTSYGLVGVVATQGSTIKQFVMSCRVVGLDAELAALAKIIGTLAAKGTVTAELIHTDANAPVRDLWQRAGLYLTPQGWMFPRDAVPQSISHVEFSASADVAALA